MKKTSNLNIRWIKKLIITSVIFVFASPVLASWENMYLSTPSMSMADLEGDAGQVTFSGRFAPSNPGIVYMGIDTSGMWKSENGGDSWRHIPNGFINKGVLSIAVDPNNEDNVLVAGSIQRTTKISAGQPGAGEFPVGAMDGIYQTTNGGDSWSRVFASGYMRSGAQDNIVYVDSNTIYAGLHWTGQENVNKGLIKSTNGGATWDSLNILQTDVIGQVAIAGNNKLYIGTANGLYTLENDTILTPIGGGLPAGQGIQALAADGDTIYVSPRDQSNNNIYKSTNGGLDFSPVNSGLAIGRPVLNIEISQANSSYVYISALGHIWYSHDGGGSWDRVDDIDPDHHMRDIGQKFANKSSWVFGSTLIPHPTNQNIAIGFGDGHYPIKTTTGDGTWPYSGDGFKGMAGHQGHTSFLWDKNNSNKWGTLSTDWGLFITENDGTTFVNKNMPRIPIDGGAGHHTGGVGVFHPTDSNIIVASDGDWTRKRIVVSVDNGVTWTIKDGTNGGVDTLGTKVHPFAIANHHTPGEFFIGKFRTVDNGQTWTELSHIVYAAYQGNQDSEFALYSRSSNSSNHIIIHRSVDKGVTWTNPYPTITNYYTSDIKELVVAPDNPDRMYLASNIQGLFIFNGTTWEIKGESEGLHKASFGNYYSNRLAIDPKYPNIIYLGKSCEHLGVCNGLYMSMDSGDSWENINQSNDANYNVTTMAVNPNNGVLHVSRSSGGYTYDTNKYIIAIRADVDQNSTINSTDAMLTLRNSLGLDMTSTNWQVSTTTGDVNCDDTTNSTDAMLILRQSLGLSMGGTGWCIN